MQDASSQGNSSELKENPPPLPSAPALALEPLPAKAAAEAPEPELALPRRFERYTLLKRVARGGMGEVLLATAGGIEGAERPCIVKIIRRDHVDDRSFVARFLDEARIQAQLQHPGVAQIIEATSDTSGKPYVVVEYIEGRNLSEVRTRAGQHGVRIGFPEALAVAISMGDALAHVHERTDADGNPLEIVHRDLSPQNVMVSYSGDLKLIDFGTARGQNRRCQTIAGIVFAKPGYVAPEVANNTPGGVPADLYALGIMLWELVAGRRFLVGEATQHMAAVGAGKRTPTPVATLIGAPPELDFIIGRLTALRAEDRYPSARLAVSDLAKLLQRAPSMADGDRSVRGRIAQLMQKLYPAEPARSRSEFARLVAEARAIQPPPPEQIPASPVPPTADDDPALLPGTRYRIVRELGRGSGGVVHEAYHIDLLHSVALKVLERESLSVESRTRFRTEARAIMQLSHEGLVKLYEFGVTQDGRPYYAMELLNGESLDHYLERDRSMPYAEAFRVGIQACRALEAAHAAGVIHRDIKPANLFMLDNGKLKLVDFGVAKAAFEASRPSENDVSRVAVVGTPEYMAPEQSLARADERSDVYGLGAVLYELITGYLPHIAENTVSLLDLKRTTPAASARARAPEKEIPEMVNQTILRALEIDPEHRYQSAAELRMALEAALKEPERARARRRTMGFAVLGLVTAVLGAIGFTGAQNPEVRARGLAAIAPVIKKVADLRARGVGAAAPPVAVAAAKIAPPKVSAPAGDDGVVEASSVPEQNAALALTDTTASEAEQAEVEGDESGEDTQAASDALAANDTQETAPAPAPETNPVVDKALADAETFKQNGNKIKALNVLRRAARKAPKDARVLQALASAAEELRAWGEATRVTRRWAEAEKSVEARLALARLERKTGHRARALRVVNRVLKDNPDSTEAQAMLTDLRGTERVSLRQ